MKTYLGVSFNENQMSNWKDSFKVVTSDSSCFKAMSDIHQHCEDEGVFDRFKYRYVIIAEGADYGLTMKGDNGEEVEAELYNAYLVPTLEYIHESKFDDIKSLFGIEEEGHSWLDETDFAEEGYGVPLGSVMIPAKDHWDDDIISGFATAIETVDRFLGFYLDKPINAIGTNGWNLLEMAMTEKSFADFIRFH